MAAGLNWFALGWCVWIAEEVRKTVPRARVWVICKDSFPWGIPSADSQGWAHVAAFCSVEVTHIISLLYVDVYFCQPLRNWIVSEAVISLSNLAEIAQWVQSCWGRHSQCECKSQRKLDWQAEMRNTLKLSKQKVFPVVWPDLSRLLVPKASQDPASYPQPWGASESPTLESTALTLLTAERTLGISKRFATSFSYGLSSLGEWKPVARCTSVPSPTHPERRQHAKLVWFVFPFAKWLWLKKDLTPVN